MHQFTFSKDERLSSKRNLDRLFAEGKSVFSFPLKVIFLPSTFDPDFPARIVISVPKRNFKRAIARNLIRRRIREAYRLNKHRFYPLLNAGNIKLDVVIIYVDKAVQDFSVIEKGVVKAFEKVCKQLNIPTK